jgi:hypothetical protein
MLSNVHYKYIRAAKFPLRFAAGVTKGKRFSTVQIRDSAGTTASL